MNKEKFIPINENVNKDLEKREMIEEKIDDLPIETPTEILGRETKTLMVEYEKLEPVEIKKRSELFLKNTAKNGEIPEYKTKEPFDIKEARILITDLCPYSCEYCGIFHHKRFKKNMITEEEYRNRDQGSNEGDMIKNYNEARPFYLSPEDYKFLLAFLNYYFNTEDVTLTGGDPFKRKEVREIISAISSLGIETTALTKGAPLFTKSEENLAKKAGMAGRIIFSLDTMDPEKHSSRNLPLKPREEAIEYLPKTLETIRKANREGYRVDINTVVDNIDFSDLEKCDKCFNEIRKIIDFAIENKISKLKFIELESKKTENNPFIEEFFKKMRKRGYFSGLELLEWLEPKNQEESLKRFPFALIKRDNDVPLRLTMYRCTCPATILGKKNPKLCEFRKSGSLYITSIGEAITCNRLAQNDNTLVSLRSSIIERDILKLLDLVQKVNLMMKKRKCPVK